MISWWQAKEWPAIELIVDGCLRKLGIGSSGWDSFSSEHIRELAHAILKSEPMTRTWDEVTMQIPVGRHRHAHPHRLPRA